MASRLKGRLPLAQMQEGQGSARTRFTYHLSGTLLNPPYSPAGSTRRDTEIISSQLKTPVLITGPACRGVVYSSAMSHGQRSAFKHDLAAAATHGKGRDVSLLRVG